MEIYIMFVVPWISINRGFIASKGCYVEIVFVIWDITAFSAAIFFIKMLCAKIACIYLKPSLVMFHAF